MKQIEIFDTTCRDGEQATKDGFIEKGRSKLIIARKLHELGVSTIEAGFPVSSPGDFAAVQAIAREVHGPYIAALAHCDKKAIDAAWNAIKDNENPTVHVFTYMIDPKSLAAYSKERFRDDIIIPSVSAVRYAKEIMRGRGRVEFSAQNATLGIPEQVYRIYSEVIESGADVVNLPDTAGYSYPFEVFSFFRNFFENVAVARSVVVSAHCHDDLGNATANTVAAIMAGATQAECTINGIGERAGNASLEEVVMNFRTRKNSEFFVDIDTALFGETSRLVSYHSQISVQQNKAIVGAGAFRHSSGIHQDGVLKGAAYEIMSSGDVGWDGESIEITARSGKMGYQHRLERLGYASSDISACIEKIRDFGKALADEKGRLNDLDLRVITDTIVSPVRSRIVYKKTIRFVKEDGKYSAEVLLEVDGREVRGSSKHEGSIDALCSAIDSAVGIKLPKLIEYHPVNIGKGHSAVNETTIVLGENGRELTYAVKEPIYIGRARHQDTIEAAGRAYVDAINRYMSTNLT